MKSYVVALALGMLLAAFYAVQNSGTVIVKFLTWQWSLHQGIWEVLVFAAGAVLMWITSLFAQLEYKNRYKSDTKELKRRIAELEDEKRSLLNALQREGNVGSREVFPQGEYAANEGVEAEK
jgi:uncharacterized integral membrane protein